MHERSLQSPMVARRPRSTFGTLTVAGFGGAALTTGLLALVIGSPNNTALLIVAAALLVCAGLALARVHWMSLVLAVLGGIFLYQIVRQPFVAYHLANPKTGGFLEFILDVLITALVFVAFGASV